ncbi:hypothetical protein CH371_12815 [Leptospira wolffii]|uniref:Uncharacterized protein n=1 Tax=Leptospira wolffii TaxID=409998 RepID=A0A2M9ZA16_9LEPT|nr:Pr6Pr family membrane protein [Leptospira wolffii]PJZ65275.1 hypothetical protein CH371_12815 [Leptospira wolffii]
MWNKSAQTVARCFFALTAFSCFIGVAMELWWSYHHESLLPPNAGFTRTFGPGFDSFFNQFAFFTTQSNLILGVTNLFLALGTTKDSRSLPIWRLVGVINILITGIVFNFILPGREREAFAEATSFIEHALNPILGILGWIVFGPAGFVTLPRILLAACVPILYAIFTLVRGAIILWYPYNILDVTRLGYGGVSVNIIGIFILFLAIAGVLALLDRWIGSKSSKGIGLLRE